MTALVGGLVAVALGLIGLGLWWREFLGLLAGGLPLLLLLGGALAVYLGYEETKDKLFKKTETPAYEPPKTSEAEVEKYKAEVESLKSEIEDLKKK
jgi:cell division protein FtsB